MESRSGRRWAVWLLVAVAVVALPVGGIAAVRAADSRPQLRSEVDRLVLLVDATAREATPGRAWLPSPDNPDISPETLSDPQESAGMDHCDYWWNLVLEGWQTGYGYQTAIPSEEAWRDVLADVRAYWEGLGYEVEVVAIDGHSQLSVDLGHSRLSLYLGHSRLPLHRVLGQAVLTGSTDCLPTG